MLFMCGMVMPVGSITKTLVGRSFQGYALG